MSSEVLFRYWNELLKDDYREPGEEGSKGISCSLLALALAEKLQEEGKEYDIVCLHPEVNGALSPTKYKHLRWGGHVVVRSEGLVYDPIVDNPMQMGKYLEELFPGQVKRVRSIPLSLCKDNPYLKGLELGPEL